MQSLQRRTDCVIKDLTCLLALSAARGGARVTNVIGLGPIKSPTGVIQAGKGPSRERPDTDTGTGTNTVNVNAKKTHVAHARCSGSLPRV